VIHGEFAGLAIQALQQVFEVEEQRGEHVGAVGWAEGDGFQCTQISAFASFCFIVVCPRICGSPGEWAIAFSASPSITPSKEYFMPVFFVSHRFMKPLLAVPFVLALAACGGGDSSSSTGSSGGGSSPGGSSSSGANCNYPDKVTASERAQANACGIQVSGAYGAADARLQQIIQACQLGQKAAADADYAGPYTKLVQYARDVSKELSCGSGGGSGPVLPNPSTQTYYNFCAKTSGNTKYGSCWGPVFKDDGGCSDNSYTYMNQYSSSSACITARDSWLKAR